VDVATLVIAVSGLVLSVIALAWQAVTWHLSGPRVKVELRLGAADGRTYSTVPATSNWRRHLQEMSRQGARSQMFAVEIVNTGRQATTVTGYKAETDTGVGTGVVAPPAHLPTLPHRLEAESSVLYYLPLQDVAEILELLKTTGQEAKTVRMTVTLGSGKVKTTDAVSAADLIAASR
jgi:hypothetical protein